MPVLQRQELEQSPLADLHAVASELGIEGFRTLRRERLIDAILAAQGAEESTAEQELGVATEAGMAEPEPESGLIATEADVVDEEEAAAEPGPEAPEPEPEEEAAAAEPGPEAPEPEPEEVVTGVLDILPNGSGFLRADAGVRSGDDVYVSPAQIRRCELRAGDEVAGPVRPPRRAERHPALVRVEQVNGAAAEPPEQRPHFADLTPIFATERFAVPPALEGVPFGKGSRVAVGGPPGAGATTLLREIVAMLKERHPDLELAVVLAGARPEEMTEWSRSAGVAVTGGTFDRPIEGQAQAAELAVERAKRRVERGQDSALVVDSLDALPPAVARRVFGAARRAEEGGSLTVIAATGTALEPQRAATTRIMLDAPAPDVPAPRVSQSLSSVLHRDLLA
jgi:transcription termination factor Rho